MTLAQYHWGQVWGETRVPFHVVGAAVTQHSWPLSSLLPGGGASGKGGFVKRTRPVKPNTFSFLLGTSYLLFLVASFPKAGP